MGKGIEEKAQELVCKACEESGLQVASWENFAAWKDFVAGRIGEQELVQKARDEMDQVAVRFGKYLIIDEEEPSAAMDDENRKGRMKRANKLYKEVCRDAEINLCFFHNFSVWQDFVAGNMSEEEFQAKARGELEKMAMS